MTTLSARSMSVRKDAKSGTYLSALSAAWLLAAAAILAPEQYLAVRALGWGFAAYRILKQPQEGLFFLAFFTPLFNNFGVVPIDFFLRPIQIPGPATQHTLASVFFSIKPVHIITILLIVSLSVRKRLFFKDTLDWAVVGSLIGIFAISILSGAYGPDPLKAFRVSFNFALLIVLCKVLMSMIDRRDILWDILRYYFLGVVFLCVVHMANTLGGFAWFGQDTRFNNHFGFQLSMSMPLILCLMLTAPRALDKVWYLGVLSTGIFCVLLSLSRSSMYSSLMGMIFFFILLLVNVDHRQKVRVLKFALVGILLISACVAMYEGMYGGSEFTSLFRGKLISFFSMFDLTYWKHSIREDPNGGMFGERFVQLRFVKQLFLQRWAFGEGWTNRVISFHGLFYTMLTGTGLLGFSLFVYFLYRMFRALGRALVRDTDATTKMLGVAMFSSLAIWILHCLLDTYFLQFHIWLVLAMALAYIKLILRPGPVSSQP